MPGCSSENPREDQDTGDLPPDGVPRAGLVRLALVGAGAGAIAGVVGSAFRMALIQAEALREATISWAQQWPAFGWLVPIVLAASVAVLVEWMVQRFAPLTAGSAMPQVEQAIRGEARPAPLQDVPVTFVGGILAIGAGLAVGREGTSAHMASTIGARLALWTRCDKESVQTIQGANFSAGLGVAFNAPLAGLIYLFEGLKRRFTPETIVAALASSGAALLVMRMLPGNASEYAVGPLPMPPGATVLACLALGVLIGVAGAGYNRATGFWVQQPGIFHRLSGRARAAVVGAVVGLVAWFEPMVVGDGTALAQEVLSNGLSISFLAMAVVVRWLLGPFSLAAGTPGGYFTPALVVGAVIGSLFAQVSTALAPMLSLDPVTCALAGMAAFIAAILRIPLTGIAIVLAATGTVTPLVPILAACLTATMVPILLHTGPISSALSEPAAPRRLGRGG